MITCRMRENNSKDVIFMIWLMGFVNAAAKLNLTAESGIQKFGLLRVQYQ